MAAWNTMAIRRQRKWRISASGRVNKSWPSSITRPAVNRPLSGSSRIRQLAMEVLPQPDSPTRPRDWPRANSKLTPRTAFTGPCLVR